MRRRSLDTDHLVVDQDDRADLPRHALEFGDVDGGQPVAIGQRKPDSVGVALGR